MTNPYEIVGYADRPSVRPGEQLQLMVSTSAPEFDARLVGLRSRRGVHRNIESAVAGRYPGRKQPLILGSHIIFEQAVPAPEAAVLSVRIRPTRPSRGDVQAIMSWGEACGLFVSAEGRLELRWRGHSLFADAALEELRWYDIEASIDPRAARISLACSGGDFGAQASVSALCTRFSPAAAAPFCIAGCVRDHIVTAHFDGKIERPKIAAADGTIVAEWDFAREPASSRVIDIGPRGLHGKAINHPQRAVTGSSWTGEITHFAQAPEQYGAISFHCDDLTDAGWQPSCSLTIPRDLGPGFYGLEIDTGTARDCIPFVVRPPEGARTADAVFLVPTFSYLAYANERHWWGSPAVEAIAGAPLEKILTPADRWAAEQGLLSAYDLHRDGTGSCHSSWRRPLLNIRPDYLHPLLRGPHQLSADLYVTDWLERIGCPVDLLTDHDLHRDGVEALRGYKVLITGSHPEYASTSMLDALQAFVRGGGNLMYLGGNGFYAVTSTFGEDDRVVEIRRGRYGIIPWFSEPGESHHASTGEPCGQWRLRGRAPQRLFGIGMAGVTFGPAEPFVRTPESRSPEFAWAFDGVNRDSIDARGDLMGGPAGFEFDRIDHSLGSPYSTVRLATATDFKEFPVMLADDSPLTGYIGEMRADISYVEYPGGGAIFSAGSVTWSTCLLADDGDNDVARMTGNVLNRFLER